MFPYGLAKKRLWNKKYPICIQLYNSEDLYSQELVDGGETPGQEREDSEKTAGDCKAETLYLFGRTGRSKEEWYQHLLRATQGSLAGRQDGTRSDSRTGVFMLIL